MKVNFNGIYRDIKKLVDAPISRDDKIPSDHEFKDVLASISPFSTSKKPEIISIDNGLGGKIEISPDARKESESDPTAQLNFNTPSLEFPEINPIQILGSDDEVEDGSVKTPSILSAKRVEVDGHHDSFGKLSKSQRIDEVKKLLIGESNTSGIDPLLGISIVSTESAFDSKAVSQDGHFSKGLFQLLDSTGADVMARAGLKADYNPFDPKLNVKLGVSYLRYLHEIFSNETVLPNNMKTVPAANSASLEKLAVAAFNAGEGRVASAQARASKDKLDPSLYENIEAYLPEITKNYVKKVQANKEIFAEKFDS